MTDVYREEVVHRRIRFIVPCAEPWGATLKDVQLALHQAMQEREKRGLSNEYDDSLRFLCEDDKLVVFFDVAERQTT